MTTPATAAVDHATPILGSFWYLRGLDLTAQLRTRDVDFFADSGAFSAHTTGAVVDLSEYAEWLTAHAAVINCAAGLDVIGDHRATARNLDQLTEKVGDRVTIVPTFHAGSPWPELERLCRDHPYVALGGAVWAGRRHEAMMRWLIQCHRVAERHDTRLHGFGLTRPPYPTSLPWYSVDSSYWNSAARSGTVSLWDGRRMVTIRVGRPQTVANARLIRRYGGDPRTISTPGFGLQRVVGSRGRDDRRWLLAASVASLRAMEAHTRMVWPPVPPPRSGTTTGDGPKVYLAAVDVREIDEIRHYAAVDLPTYPAQLATTPEVEPVNTRHRTRGT